MGLPRKSWTYCLLYLVNLWYTEIQYLNVEKNRPMNPLPFLPETLSQKRRPGFVKLARLGPRNSAFVWKIHRMFRQSLRYGLTLAFCIAFMGGKPTKAQSTESSAPSSEIIDRMPEDIQRRIALIVSQYNDMGWDLSEYLADDRFQYIEGITEKFTRSAERRIESFEDYKEILAYEIKKNKLAEFYTTYSAELLAAEKEFGIPKEIIMGILGVESEFGRYKGSYNPLNAYISMMAEDYRYSFAEAQLIELLRFCKRTGLDVMSLQSSYAGAMSYAQFIPYSLNRWWKNSEGQGLYHMPDNIRSVANYLAHFTEIEGNVKDAILRYNTSSLYQQAVLSLAEDAKQVIP
jgi:membrane-bound lytic murein transglycosylase B